MLKEAIQHITDLAVGQVLTAHGKAYSRFGLLPLASPEPECKPVVLHTLSGLLLYASGGADNCNGFDFNEYQQRVAFFVGGPTKVSLRSTLFGDFRQRETLAECTPFGSRSFPFGRYLSAEEFIVGLQAGFVQDEVTAEILRVVGNLRAEAVQTVVDDGISQQVTARSGVAHVDNVKVPNPVELRPFRTFQEIEQPVSRYVLRVRRGGDGNLPEIALHEAMDDRWQTEAVDLIGKYLMENVAEVPVFS